MSHKGPWRERRLRVRRNPDGSEAGTFDLKIRKTGPVYDLSYNRDGKLLFLGVGIDTSDGIAAGYGKAE